MARLKLGSQAIRFLCVGGAATALHYLVMILVVQLQIARPVGASSVGFLVGAIFNYLANRHFTFRSTKRHREAFPRFALVATSGLAINASIVWLIHDLMSMHYLLGQVIATLGTLVWNYTLNRMWTFASSAHKAPR
ncbi:GtrA family protein [Thauera phenolivorans]|uniref:GtrA family protein n=1 Tax=Thauera phenolivorans TaxID=1792543 RepID=UPI0009F2142C|nr:GtrA family protein [Thauera phenolivorans]